VVIGSLSLVLRHLVPSDADDHATAAHTDRGGRVTMSDVRKNVADIAVLCGVQNEAWRLPRALADRSISTTCVMKSTS
jgi:hypothetical protein